MLFARYCKGLKSRLRSTVLDENYFHSRLEQIIGITNY